MDKINRVRDGWFEYQRISERIEMLESIAEKTTTNLTGLPRAQGDGSTAGDSWAMLADYRAECEHILRRYLKDCKDLEEELSCIRNDRIRTTMKYRYIDSLSIEEIAERMGCEPRTIYYQIKKGKDIYESTYGK